MNSESKKNKRIDNNRGVTLIELLVGLVVSAIIFAGVYQMMGMVSKQSTSTMRGQRMDQDLDRFLNLVSSDILRAGSDPNGEALQAYILESTCAGLIFFKYGINPEPADPTCTIPLGEIGILSYLAYDVNGDGAIDPEEGIDLVNKPPALRSAGEDYIVYDFYDSDGDAVDDAIMRKNLADPSTTDDDIDTVVLTNVLDFQIRYYGPDESGDYGLIDTSTRHDDIREVEVSVTLRAKNPEEGYENPLLPGGSPYKNYRTVSSTIRLPLLVRKD